MSEPQKDSGHDTDTSGPIEPVTTGGGVVEQVDGKAVFKPTRAFLLAYSGLMVLALGVLCKTSIFFGGY
jgi:hypothetical protein